MTEIFSQLIKKVEIVTADLIASNFGLALILWSGSTDGCVFTSFCYFNLRRSKNLGCSSITEGTNVVGAFGLLQSGADMLKLVFKVVYLRDRIICIFLAPVVSFVMAILAWAVIPLNDGWQLPNLNVAILYVLRFHHDLWRHNGWLGFKFNIHLVLCVLYKQMISYEVSIGLVIIGS